jgi:hypothetical protein
MRACIPAPSSKAPTLLAAAIPTTQGYLLPDFHKSYWIGLQSPEVPNYGRWGWVDNSPAPGSRRAYSHWGTVVPTGAKEPDQGSTCVAANSSEAFMDPPAWGWSDAACDLALPFMCRRAPEGTYVYVSNTTQATYILNTSMANWADAKQVCNDNGGHLVSYQTPDEQSEVEGYYERSGMFITRYHIFYWTGLVSDQQMWPQFRCVCGAGEAGGQVHKAWLGALTSHSCPQSTECCMCLDAVLNCLLHRQPRCFTPPGMELHSSADHAAGPLQVGGPAGGALLPALGQLDRRRRPARAQQPVRRGVLRRGQRH